MLTANPNLSGGLEIEPQVGLATPSTFRGCREVAYATLLDLHVAAREASSTIPDENGTTMFAEYGVELLP